MSNMYVAVESFIILCRPLQIIIMVQVIEGCFMMNKIANKKFQEHLSLKNLTEMDQQ